MRIGNIGIATPITGYSNRWVYSIRPTQVLPTHTLLDPDEILDSTDLETLPGLNLAEMANTTLTTRGYLESNIPDSFSVKAAEGLCIYFPAFMVFDQAADADPEPGCLFFSINAIDGGCS